MSNELDIRFPAIRYDQEKRHMYEYLKNDLSSPFVGSSFAVISMFAMAIAKKHGMSPSKLSDNRVKMPTDAFHSEMRVFIRSLLIEENNDVYAIGDNGALRRMCEGYANAGIDVLYTKIKRRPVEKNKEDVFTELFE